MSPNAANITIIRLQRLHVHGMHGVIDVYQCTHSHPLWRNLCEQWWSKRYVPVHTACRILYIWKLVWKVHFGVYARFLHLAPGVLVLMLMSKAWVKYSLIHLY